MPEKRKIALIDVEHKTKEIIKNALPDWQINLVKAVEVLSDLSIIKDNDTAAVILQAQSNKADTVKICESVSAELKKNNIPLLVAICRRDDVTQIQYALESGADKCFITPTTEMDVKEKIEELLSAR